MLLFCSYSPFQGEKSMKLFMRLQYSLILLLLASCSAPTTDFPSKIFVFGDSLSDTGNAYLATQGAEPGPDYYLGRFSNGRLYVDQLAEHYDKKIRPAFPGINGSNYAIAGSTSDGVLLQVKIYLENNEESLLDLSNLLSDSTSSSTEIVSTDTSAVNIEENYLYIVWAGSNDMRALLNNQAGANDIDTAVAKIRTTIENLASAGAKHFLVPNIPDLGIIPEVTEREATVPGISQLATSYSTDFNTALDAMLDGLIINGTDIIKFDIFQLLNTVADKPSEYGLTNTTDRCYVDSDNICDTPQSYLFWDGLHPTAAVHSIIAQAFIDVIPK